MWENDITKDINRDEHLYSQTVQYIHNFETGDVDPIQASFKTNMDKTKMEWWLGTTTEVIAQVVVKAD